MEQKEHELKRKLDREEFDRMRDEENLKIKKEKKVLE